MRHLDAKTPVAIGLGLSALLFLIPLAALYFLSGRLEAFAVTFVVIVLLVSAGIVWRWHRRSATGREMPRWTDDA